jgi:hypothetical protein
MAAPAAFLAAKEARDSEERIGMLIFNALRK